MNTQNNQSAATTQGSSQASTSTVVSEPTGPSITEVLNWDPFAPPKADASQDASTTGGADGAAAGSKEGAKPAVTGTGSDADPAAAAATVGPDGKPLAQAAA